MNIVLFKEELTNLFDRHGIVLEKIDISVLDGDLLASPNNAQVLYSFGFWLEIAGRFKELTCKF